MKICLINNLFHPLKAGGAEKIVENLALILVSLGHEVSVVTIGESAFQVVEVDGYKIVSLENKFIYHRINADKQSIFKKLIFHWQNVFSHSHAKQLEEYLLKNKQELVWTHNLSGFGWRAISLINKLNLRHWHQVHDFQLVNPFGTFLFSEKSKLIRLPFKYKIYSHFAKRLFGQTELVVSPSQFLLNFYQQNGFFANCKTAIFPNPFVGNEAKSFLQSNEAKNFLYIGQIEDYKGVVTLVEVFKRIDEKSINLEIIGEGSLLKTLIQVCENDNRIKFLGWKNKSQVTEAIIRNDVVIYPSECFENQPTVIIEAQSLARPVVASNIGGISEMISDQTGLLVAPKQKDEWVKVIQKLIDGHINLKQISINSTVQAAKYSTTEYKKLLSNFL